MDHQVRVSCAGELLASQTASEVVVEVHVDARSERALRTLPARGWNLSLELARRLKARADCMGAPFQKHYKSQHVLGFTYPANVLVSLEAPCEARLARLRCTLVGSSAVRQADAIEADLLELLSANDGASPWTLSVDGVAERWVGSVGSLAATWGDTVDVTITPARVRASPPARDSLAPAATARALVYAAGLLGVRSALCEAQLPEGAKPPTEEAQGALVDELRSTCRAFGRALGAELDEACVGDDQVWLHSTDFHHSSTCRGRPVRVDTLQGHATFARLGAVGRAALAYAALTNVGRARGWSAHRLKVVG
ncbi:MAG: hypothetical protein H6716_27235 [Polyangiaceae bacterium]|nr:hypothetical protein [Polyangiaceae bacterium]